MQDDDYIKRFTAKVAKHFDNPLLEEVLTATFSEALQGYKHVSTFDLDLSRLEEVKIKEPLILYQVFGWNEEMLGACYQQACLLYQKERYKEALQAFTFLSLMSPLSPDVWKAFGIACLACNKGPEAQEAEQMCHYLEQ